MERAHSILRGGSMKRRIAVATVAQTCEVLIHKDPDDKYRVDRIFVPSGTTVTWKADGFTPTQLVVFLPPATSIEHKEPTHKVGYKKGVYHYSLYVKENEEYYAVEGNSPPEMIIE